MASFSVVSNIASMNALANLLGTNLGLNKALTATALMCTLGLQPRHRRGVPQGVQRPAPPTPAVGDHDEPHGRTVAAIWPQLQIAPVNYSDRFLMVRPNSGP